MGSSPASPPRTAGQWFRWTVLALVCISLGTLLVMAQQVSRELQNLSEEPLDDINWNLTQLEVDLLLFGGAIQIHAITNFRA